MIPKILTFVDVETTGTNPNHDRIIEIGLARVVGGELRNTYQTLVDPQMYLPTDITSITGITQDHLENAPAFSQIKDSIDELCRDSVVVAHNARFDTAFLKAEYSRINGRFENRYFCTAKLSRMLFPQYRHHNLDSIIERFNLVCELRHRAFSDAVALWDFFRIIKKSDEDKLAKAVKKLLKRPALPQGVSEKMVNKLEDKPGVYIFYSSAGAPLYVGKSINIKTRVLSHFYSDQKSSREFIISQQVDHIESRVTEGELEALLLEKRLIGEIQPTYNRKLRNMHKMTILTKKTTKEGYDTVGFKNSSQIDPDSINSILAVFRSLSQTKRELVALAKEYDLCHKLLGLEKTRGRCFGSQIEQCKGACTSKEPPLNYNMRFAQAFANTKVKQWPFPGAVIIPEGRKGHLIYKWCYLASLDSEDAAQRSFFDHPQFDYDTYKILARYLLDPKVNRKVRNYKGNLSF